MQNSSPIENSNSSQLRSEDRVGTSNSQRDQDPESTSNTPRDQAQDAEYDPNSPSNISMVIAVESGVGSRSSSLRNLIFPSAFTLSAVGLGCSIVTFVGGLVYQRPNSSTQFSNQTLARARENEMERQEAILRLYQNAMIPIVTVGLGALLFQQSWSYMQRNGLIGPRRQMIEEDRAISADLVFNHPDRTQAQASLHPIDADRPSPSLNSREGENLSFPTAQLQQARPPRYVV